MAVGAYLLRSLQQILSPEVGCLKKIVSLPYKFVVHPEQEIIEELAEETVNYLNTNEGFQLLSQVENRYTIHRDKLPREISRLFDIHPEKLPYEIQHQLRHRITRDGWLRVDGGFAKFYMTLLANKICEREVIVPLTDNSLTSNFSDLIRLDNKIVIYGRDRYYDYRPRHRDRYINFSQGLLINMAIEGISIADSTSLEDVVSFKYNRQNQMTVFSIPNVRKTHVTT